MTSPPSCGSQTLPFAPSQAVAVDSAAPFRIEWAGHDVTGADGTRIEAKSAA
jgi:hypothetical protein